MFAIKRELKLNNVETSLMRGNSGFKRFVYNFALELLQESWGFDGIKDSDSQRLDAIKKVFTSITMNRPEYTWMRKYPSTVYQSAFISLKNALNRWRKGISEFPNKKAKKNGDSFTVYKSSGIYPIKGEPALPFTNRVIIQVGKRITLPGLTTYRLKEKINFICSSQTFTVSRVADKWFVAFNLDAEKIPPIIHPVEKIGLDLGVKVIATCSDESTYEMPLTTKKAKTKLSKMNWQNRKKIMGNKKLKIKASKNAQKFYLKSSRHSAHIANIRQDTTQKMTTDLSRKASTIRIEDLNIGGMVKNHKSSAAVSNNCVLKSLLRRETLLTTFRFYEVRRQLIYKQQHYGTKVELVDRWYPSSKMCSKCKHIQDMSLSDRVFNCQNPECGNIQDRDFNAATNLVNAPMDRIRLA